MKVLVLFVLFIASFSIASEYSCNEENLSKYVSASDQEEFKQWFDFKKIEYITMGKSTEGDCNKKYIAIKCGNNIYTSLINNFDKVFKIKIADDCAIKSIVMIDEYLFIKGGSVCANYPVRDFAIPSRMQGLSIYNMHSRLLLLRIPNAEKLINLGPNYIAKILSLR